MNKGSPSPPPSHSKNNVRTPFPTSTTPSQKNSINTTTTLTQGVTRQEPTDEKLSVQELAKRLNHLKLQSPSSREKNRTSTEASTKSHSSSANFSPLEQPVAPKNQPPPVPPKPKNVVPPKLHPGGNSQTPPPRPPKPSATSQSHISTSKNNSDDEKPLTKDKLQETVLEELFGHTIDENIDLDEQQKQRLFQLLCGDCDLILMEWTIGQIKEITALLCDCTRCESDLLINQKQLQIEDPIQLQKETGELVSELNSCLVFYNQERLIPNKINEAIQKFRQELSAHLEKIGHIEKINNITIETNDLVERADNLMKEANDLMKLADNFKKPANDLVANNTSSKNLLNKLKLPFKSNVNKEAIRENQHSINESKQIIRGLINEIKRHIEYITSVDQRLSNNPAEFFNHQISNLNKKISDLNNTINDIKKC